LDNSVRFCCSNSLRRCSCIGANHLRYPLPKPSITARYAATANRANPHRGLDFGASAGTWITAPATGTIVLNKWSDVLGNCLVLRFWHEGKSQPMYLGFAHLKVKSKHKVGTKIWEGNSWFAAVGNTGSASRGSHLHLTYGDTPEHIFYGRTFDPEALLERYAK
jgi:murein DD-endopeptidase MepM/ murein hydrolase activator NlpD